MARRTTATDRVSRRGRGWGVGAVEPAGESGEQINERGESAKTKSANDEMAEGGSAASSRVSPQHSRAAKFCPQIDDVIRSRSALAFA